MDNQHLLAYSIPLLPKDHENSSVWNLTPLHGDGSSRRFFRINSQNKKDLSYLIMKLYEEKDIHAFKKNAYDWIEIQKELSAHHFNVPRIINTHLDENLIIMEDLGDMTLERFVSIEKEHSIQSIYGQIFDSMISFLSLTPIRNSSWHQRGFHFEKLFFEMVFFKEKFLSQYLKSVFLLDEKKSVLITQNFRELCSFIELFPKYFVHRDFHSRNILLKDGKEFFIDFQDALLGPSSYDMVSLIFDPYVGISFQTRKDLLEMSTQKIEAQMGQQVADEIRKSWKAVTLHRLFKALGSFAYLAIDKNQKHFFRSMKPAISILQSLDLKEKKWEFISHDLIEHMSERVTL